MAARAGSAHGRPISPRLSSPRLTLGMAQPVARKWQPYPRRIPLFLETQKDPGESAWSKYGGASRVRARKVHFPAAFVPPAL